MSGLREELLQPLHAVRAVVNDQTKGRGGFPVGALRTLPDEYLRGSLDLHFHVAINIGGVMVQHGSVPNESALDGREHKARSYPIRVRPVAGGVSDPSREYH